MMDRSQRYYWHGWVLLCVFVLSACKNDGKSYVPDYPVYLDIQITAKHNTFVPDGTIRTLTYIEKEKEGQYLGYGGVLVWTNIIPEYRAADMTCPNCLQPKLPVEVDGMFAVCPICGETYDLSTYGFPTKGIANQPLKQYGVSVSYDATGTVLRIRN